jgi:hypothetical protein
MRVYIHQSPLSTHLVTISISQLDQVIPLLTPNIGLANQGEKRWMPPPVGCVKMNVDVGVSVNDNIGAPAAICRQQFAVTKMAHI